jgi:hypothetical protein
MNTAVQYKKSENKFMASLLRDERIQAFDLIALQESMEK